MNPDYLRPIADHLWQSSFFAGTAGLMTVALRKNRARLRHWLWLTASCKFLIPLSVLFALGGQLAWRTAPPTAPAHLPAVMQQLAQPFTSPDDLAPLVPSGSPPASQLPALLMAIWACGFAGIGFAWWIRWLRIRTAVRKGSPAPLAIPIPAVSMPGLPEPSVFGILRPVLLLPEGISEQLTPAQLQAVIAHELCHVRYRDNLAAMLQMLVETVFWFHPLVWWIGKRMVAEREHACDEEVLACGNNPDSYAEAILKICRFCLESPLPCVNGIGGSALRQRLIAILTPPALRRLHPIKKLMLAALALVFVTGPLALGLLEPPRARAQQAATAPMSFDVVSIKPFPSMPVNPAIQRSGGRIRWTAAVNWMVLYAYRVQAFQEAGMPQSANYYVIDAETSPDATDDQIRLMVQSLLANRFRFLAHRKTQQLPGYALLPAKGGVKIRPATASDAPAALPEWFGPNARRMPSGMKDKMLAAYEGKSLALAAGPGLTGIYARRAAMSQFAETLADQLRAPVLDHTGLSGEYSFDFKYVDVNAPADADSSVPTLFGALTESLGLRLEKQTVPVEMLVVDHVEKTPTGN